VAARETAPRAAAEKSRPWSPRGLWGDARRSAQDRSSSLPVLIWRYLYRNWFLGNLVRVSPRGVINFVHRRRGVKMGRDCFVDPWATLETAYPENITLGNDVRVAAGAIIMTHIKPPHHLRDTGLMPNTVKPVVLQDHCFIGVHAVIMPGVTVGKGAVVASGAVVMNNVPAYVMVAGNPAKVVKRFTPPRGDC
jgi:acetyltransferase-like isoleucine patch superfamily enzyme